jgi:hypothetical protein
VRRLAAWIIVALGVFIILDAATFTWWRGWSSGATLFTGGLGCLYLGFALLRLESAPKPRRDRTRRPRTPV